MAGEATVPFGTVVTPTESFEFRPGKVVAGKFRIERVLSEGGMGLVVAATHLDLDQLVALKFFRADVGSDRRTLLERFTREARAAARLRSEHVARVLDVAVTDDGRPYMVMEYLEGQSLDRLLRELGPLPIASVAEYAIQACEGLAEAHSRGIVHRDVSPSNLFLVRRSPGLGTIKILDFGISKVARSDLAASNVATNIMMGTPCYMSPEQIRSTATVDHRADIWSLGATLYELLTGKTPFDASQDLLALAESIVFDPAPPLRSLRPEIPEPVAAAISRCLSKDRDGRFASAGDLAMALLPFAGPQARPVAERAVSMPPSAPSPLLLSDQAREARILGQAPTEQHQVVRLRREAVPRGVLIATGVALVVCIFSWTASVLLTKRPHPAANATPNPVAAVSTARTAVPIAASPAPIPPSAIGDISDLKVLSVRVTPANARIWIDGAAAPENPFRGRFPKNGVHSIEASAKGYKTRREIITLVEDVPVDITLDKQASTSGDSAATRSASAARSDNGRDNGRDSVRADRLDRDDRSDRADRVRSDRDRSDRGRAGDRDRQAGAEPALPPVRSLARPVRPQEVDPAGGREPLRPIEVRNPYESP